MKKLLTILGTIGLTATTGVTVVSCGTKKIEITFNDLTSVTSSTWIGSDFGAFYVEDFETGQYNDHDVVVVKNKEKMAAYIAAGFKNYQQAYDKIFDDKTQIIVYRKNIITDDYRYLENVDAAKDHSQSLFFRLTDSSFKKSDHLNLNFNPNLTKEKEVFDFQKWFEAQSGSGLSLKIKDDEEKLKAREKDLEIIDTLQKRIGNAWKGFKNGSNSSLGGVDAAINSVLNYLGEYLVRIEGYVSDYSKAPMTIKQQLKNALNQNREGKDITRKALFDQWIKVESISSGDLLPFQFNALDKSMDITFNFSD